MIGFKLSVFIEFWFGFSMMHYLRYSLYIKVVLYMKESEKDG
jgi:hypothetical protein